MEHVTRMLDRTKAGVRTVRLLGIALSNLEKEPRNSYHFRQSTLDPWLNPKPGKEQLLPQ